MDESQAQQRKKPRSSNYTNTEKYDLCPIVDGLKDIIESKKKNDSVTWKDKEAAWDTVVTQFNALSPNATFRSAESLKKCFGNIKHTAKKQSADDKNEIIKTGGGRAKTVMTDPVHEKASSIMNSKTVKGLQNSFDSDALDIPVNDGDDDFRVEMLSDVTNEEYSAVMQSLVQEPNEPEIENAHNSNAVTQKNSPSTTVNDSWKRYTPTDLKRPLNKKLAPQTTKKQVSKKSESTITSQNKTPSKGNSPSKSLRRPGIIGLHSTDLAKEYSELATIKLQLAQEQLKMLQAEAEAAKIKRERDEIEFNLRKKCLELDIEIKKRQAQRLKDVLDG